MIKMTRSQYYYTSEERNVLRANGNKRIKTKTLDKTTITRADAAKQIRSYLKKSGIMISGNKKDINLTDDFSSFFG